MKQPPLIKKYHQAAFKFLSLIAEYPPFVERAREIRKRFPQASQAVSPYGVGDDYLQAVTELTCDLNLIPSLDRRKWGWIGQIHNLIWNEPAQALLPGMWCNPPPVRVTLDLEIDPRSCWTEVKEQVNQALEARRDEIESQLIYSKERPAPRLEQAAKWLFQRVVLNKKPREIWQNEPDIWQGEDITTDEAIRKAISEVASLLSIRL